MISQEGEGGGTESRSVRFFLPHKDALLQGPSFVHDPAPGDKEVAHSFVSFAGFWWGYFHCPLPVTKYL